MAEGCIERAFGSAPGAHAADETNVDPAEWSSLPAEAADGAPAANDDGAGKPVVPEQLKLDLQRVVRTPDETGNVTEQRFSKAPAQVLREAPEQGQVETSAEALRSSGQPSTFPTDPLLSGRKEATDEPDRQSVGRGESVSDSV